MTSPSVRDAGARLIIGLGITQIVSWGSIYYLGALLIGPLRDALDVGVPVIVGAYSCGLLVSGLAAPWVGRRIDRHGGRWVMTAGSLAAVLLLALLSRVQSVVALYAVYIGLGLAMSATLYPPAFAVLTQAFSAGYRRAITVLTLFGGLASTVFWPLTSVLIEQLGWREAVLVLAAINLLLCVPIHARLPRPEAPSPLEVDSPVAAAASGIPAAAAVRTAAFRLLVVAFVSQTLITSAISVHLIALLGERGLAPVLAATVAALIGPLQVVGRLGELAISRHARSVQVGRVVSWLMPLALAVLWFAHGAAATTLLLLFAAAYGVANGTMTIVRGAVPAELFGRAQYGAITGALTAPSLIAGAAAPLLAAWLLTALGDYDDVVLALTAIGVLGALAFHCATRDAPNDDDKRR
jgi:MFS family permease